MDTAALDETGCLAVLRGLLECYSPSGQEGRAVEYLVEAMRGLGYLARVDPAGNALGQRGDGPREILLLGHIDTVPGEIPVRQEDGCLYGRGAVDAKGPLACFACAAALLVPPPGWRVTVIGAVGEESDSRGAHYLCREYPPPAAVVIGEPSRWDRITLGYKGSLWLRYGVRQPLVHTAAGAGSACETAVAFWNSLRRLADDYNAGHSKVCDQLSPTLRQMSSDLDGFYESAALRIGLRLPFGLQPDQALQWILPLVGAAELQVEDSIPPYRAEKNTALVRAFLAAIRHQNGQPTFALKTGTADMNLVGPLWNCPILAYGPGDSNLDHTPDEHIEVAEYLIGIRTLRDALAQLM